MGPRTPTIFPNLFGILNRVEPVLIPNTFARESDLYNLPNAKAVAREHGIILVQNFRDYLTLSREGFRKNLVVLTRDMTELHMKSLIDAVGYAGRLLLVIPKGQTMSKKLWRQSQQLMNSVFVRVITLEEDGSINPSENRIDGMIIQDWMPQPVP